METKNIAIYILITIAIGFAGYDIGTLIFDYMASDINKQENCLIHNRIETNPPILLNANEGITTELKIFDSHYDNESKVSDKSHYGCLNVLTTEDAFLMAYPDDSYADISINKDFKEYSNWKAKKHLCKDCLAAIKEINPATNYIVVDYYDKQNIKYYDLGSIEEKELKIRHYTIEYQEGQDYKFKIISNYFEGGKTLDYEKETINKGTYYYDNEKGLVYLA